MVLEPDFVEEEKADGDVAAGEVRSSRSASSRQAIISSVDLVCDASQ